MNQIQSEILSRASPVTMRLLSQARDLNQESPLPHGLGIKNPASTARSGRTQVLLLDPKEQSRGGSWMPNSLDSPNDAAVCSLSQVLVKDSIPQQYFLSSTACAGILRRAEKRGKDLPAALALALRSVATIPGEIST